MRMVWYLPKGCFEKMLHIMYITIIIIIIIVEQQHRLRDHPQEESGKKLPAEYIDLPFFSLLAFLFLSVLLPR